MRTKNADGNLVTGVILTVFAIIIVGIIVLWIAGEVNSKKRTADRSTTKINEAMNEYAEFDLDVYDGASISGDALIELIEDVKRSKVLVSIGVKTLAGTTVYYVYPYDSDITPTPATVTVPPLRNHNAYINPNGTFVGKVTRNSNDVITLVLFTQQP